MEKLFVNVRMFFISTIIGVFAGLPAILFADDSCWSEPFTRVSHEGNGGNISIEVDTCKILRYEIISMCQVHDPSDDCEYPGIGAKAQLLPGDLIIVWDEDTDHGDGFDERNFTFPDPDSDGYFRGDYVHDPDCDYVQVSSTDSRVNWTIYRVAVSGTMTIDGDGTNEHEVIRISSDQVDFPDNPFEFSKDDGTQGGCVSPGNEITYSICWDPNDLTFEGVYIVDKLPDSVTYPEGFERYNLNDSLNPIPADPNYDPNDHSYYWYIGNIDPGDANCVTLTVTVGDDVTPGEQLYNIANMYDSSGLVASAAVLTDICCGWDGVDPNIIYVDHTADGFNNGTNWQNAYTRLRDALIRARTSTCDPVDGFLIYVAQGTYSPGVFDLDSFALPDNVSMYGGFITGGSDFAYRNPDKYETILNGRIDPNTNDRNNAVVTMGDDTLIDGFTITEANKYGIHGEEVDFAIENCTVEDNEKWGIKAEDGNVSVKWCKINDNVWHGIEHSGQGYSIEIENSLIIKNKRHALFTTYSTPIIKNCVIAKNGFFQAGFEGIKMMLPTEAPTLHNNTIAYSKKAGVSFLEDDDPNYPNYPEVENCILWYNNDNHGQIYGHDPNFLKYNCIFDSNDIDGTDYTLDANYNFTGDPCFAYSDPNLYDDGSIEFNPHLAFNSPCIDMGDPNILYTDQNDIDAEDRVVGDNIDIGADEVYSCDGDLSEDDFYNEVDINADGIVNLWEFNLLSAAWMTYEPNHPGYDPNTHDGSPYDSRCDFDSDWYVGVSDLGLFAEEWLWTACWKQSQMDRFDAQAAALSYAMDGGGESMMMAPVSMTVNSLAEPTVEEQIANIEDILIFLDNLRKNDKNLKDTISKEDWEDFIIAVESSLIDLEGGL